MDERSDAKPVLNIHAAGMDERSHQTLRRFFERQLAGTCILSDEQHAHAVLLDLDTLDGKSQLERQRSSHPDRPLIVLSRRDGGMLPANAVLVKKPVRTNTLADALKKLGTRLAEQRHEAGFFSAADDILRSQPANQGGAAAPAAHVDSRDAAALYLRSEKSFFHIGATPDLDLSVPAQRAKVFYDPGHYLQAHFQAALALSLEKRARVRLSGAAFKHFDIDAGSGKVAMPIAGSTLYAASRLPMQPSDVTIELMPAADPPAGAGDRVETVEALTWKLALWASRGRVPLDTDLEWPVFIRRWPNLTRLLVPPHAARIASLWAHRPFSLVGTIAALGVPQRLVFAFYSACLAIGIAAPTRRIADTLIAPAPPEADQRRGLLRQLLNRLMHDWTDQDAKP
jgi:hypothetical protein